MKKVKFHTKKAELNKKKAKEYLQKGKPEKANHFKRISEAHFRNAMYYLKSSQSVSLTMAF
ncbi:MAG TPA: hypothetical protein VNZ49_04245 [Bacteroidia bacterium]|jgi:hypothetical protein|nr:hypothetical protein [Bacteroidia bacterium]